MVNRFTQILSLIILVLVSYSFVTANFSVKGTKMQQTNTAPVVKIMAPKNGASYAWNTPIQYKIKVSDQEDGESSFQEIPSNEVFLQVRYVEDSTLLSDQKLAADLHEPPGLTAIKSSNCLNCHAFAGKLIGPSFPEISKRYPETKANHELLAKRVLQGSTGIWSNVTMPTHPELSNQEVQEMVEWILKKSGDPNINYYRGTEGYFTIKPPASSKSGIFLVTASYTDHGAKDQPKQKLSGNDRVTIRGK